MLAPMDAPIPSLFVSTPIEFMPLIIVDPTTAPFTVPSLHRNIDWFRSRQWLVDGGHRTNAGYFFENLESKLSKKAA